jgi:hypothetical protein
MGVLGLLEVKSFCYEAEEATLEWEAVASPGMGDSI